MKVRVLVKELLNFDMDEDVHVDAEAFSRHAVVTEVTSMEPHANCPIIWLGLDSQDATSPKLLQEKIIELETDIVALRHACKNCIKKLKAVKSAMVRE